MAKNLSREFATMSEDERRRFALEEEEGTREQPSELAFDDPREESPQYSSVPQEVAHPEHRDGMSALLDDERHQRAVRQESAKQNRSGSTGK
jgi:hypothetical protein